MNIVINSTDYNKNRMADQQDPPDDAQNQNYHNRHIEIMNVRENSDFNYFYVCVLFEL